jgi:hypothetical protein
VEGSPDLAIAGTVIGLGMTMKWLICVRDDDELSVFQRIRDLILSKRPGFDVRLLCGEPNPKLWKKTNHTAYFFEGFDGFRESFKEKTDEELSLMLAASSLPATLYKGDPQYVYREKEERDLALEQLFLEQRVRAYYESEKPDVVFVGAAGRLIWTLPSLVASEVGILSYRRFNATYINPARVGVRFWFSRNLYGRLSSDERDLMDWPEDQIAQHVELFLAGIEDESYRLDKYAKTQLTGLFISRDPMSIAMDMGKWILLGRRRSRNRLVSLKNSLLNSRLAKRPERLPKPFFLFPLNSPADEQLTLRAPQYRDLLSACELIANMMPYGHTLVLKEHPVHPGMLPHSRLKALLEYYPNIKLLSPDTSINSLLKDTSALITVNSSAAIDALVRDIPVISLGETFYKGTGLTYELEYPFEALSLFGQAQLDPMKKTRREALVRVISRFLQETYPAPVVSTEAQTLDPLSQLVAGMIDKTENFFSRT